MLVLIWEHCDVLNETFSRLFLKKCLKTVKFNTVYCSGKGLSICRAIWNWYISCIDKRLKIYLNINLLDAWAVCFLNRKAPECACCFNKINILFKIYVNFITSSYSTRQVLDQIKCILGFLMYQLFDCHG
jgi:hypothetical protein